MKKLFCVFAIVLFSLCGLHAQQSVLQTELSYADTAIERYHGDFKLVGTDEKISKETLSKMFDENTFAMYKQAHREHVAAMSLWGVSSTLLIVSALSFGLGGYSIYVWNHDSRLKDPDQPHGTPLYPIILYFGGITLAAAVLPSIPAWILTKDSHRKLDNIADTFNGRKSEVSLNVGFSPSGFGLVLNF